MGFPGLSVGKESAVVQETLVQSLGQEDPLEKGMAAHSSILAWRIPGTEEPGGLQSMGSHRAEHDRANNPAQHVEVQSTKLFTLISYYKMK